MQWERNAFITTIITSWALIDRGVDATVTTSEPCVKLGLRYIVTLKQYNKIIIFILDFFLYVHNMSTCP